MDRFLKDLHKIFFGDKEKVQIVVDESPTDTIEKATEDIVIMKGKPANKVSNNKELLSGDVVKIFGYKAKLKIREDQDGSKRYTGYNAKDKPIRFKHEDISSITRQGKVIFQRYEEA